MLLISVDSGVVILKSILFHPPGVQVSNPQEAAIEGVIAWLDARQPDQATAAGPIGLALGAIVETAQSAAGEGATLPPECR